MSDYVDGTLDERRQTALHEHLGECPACRRELDELERTVGLLQGLQEMDPPQDLLQRVRYGVRAQERRRGRVVQFLARPQVSVALAAAVLLVVFFQGYRQLILPARRRAAAPAAEAEVMPADAPEPAAAKPAVALFAAKEQAADDQPFAAAQAKPAPQTQVRPEPQEPPAAPVPVDLAEREAATTVARAEVDGNIWPALGAAPNAAAPPHSRAAQPAETAAPAQHAAKSAAEQGQIQELDALTEHGAAEEQPVRSDLIVADKEDRPSPGPGMSSRSRKTWTRTPRGTVKAVPQFAQKASEQKRAGTRDAAAEPARPARERTAPPPRAETAPVPASPVPVAPVAGRAEKPDSPAALATAPTAPIPRTAQTEKLPPARQVANVTLQTADPAMTIQLLRMFALREMVEVAERNAQTNHPELAVIRVYSGNVPALLEELKHAGTVKLEPQAVQRFHALRRRTAEPEEWTPEGDPNDLVLVRVRIQVKD